MSMASSKWLQSRLAKDFAHDCRRPSQSELLDAYAAHVLRELADDCYVKANGVEQDNKPLADWLRAEAERLERGE